MASGKKKAPPKAPAGKSSPPSKKLETKKKPSEGKKPPEKEEGGPPKDPGWISRLVTNTRGANVACASNVIDILTNHQSWRGVLQYDEFIGDITTVRPPPWVGGLIPAQALASRDWTEKDMIRLSAWLAKQPGAIQLVAPTSTVVEGARVVADQRTIHPVRDWLSSLEWDESPRLDTFFTRLAGAEDTPYVRAVSSMFFIGAVARIFRPGCQLDSMPVLEGGQGIGKTSLLRILAGDWFLSTNVEPGSKDSYQVLSRKWIVEFGELDSLGRAEISRIKQYVSQPIDTYRPSYGRVAIDKPRQCAFIGTVNPDGGGYLKDNTGARRFQPLALGGKDGNGKIDLRGVAKEREQLWAEAVARFKKGEQWHITDPEVLKAAASVAEERRQIDPWETPVTIWLNKLSRKVQDVGVTTHAVLTQALNLEEGKLTRGDEMRVSSVLRLVGWGTRKRVRVDTGGLVWAYAPTILPKACSDRGGGAKQADVIPMTPRMGTKTPSEVGTVGTSRNKKTSKPPEKDP